MRVLIVPSSETSESVFLRLAAWSAAGLLEPFCWWPVGMGETTSTVRRVTRGASVELPLSGAIVGSDPRDVAVVAFHAATVGEAFDERFDAHVDACIDTVTRVVSVDAGNPTECTMVVAPAAIAQPVPHPLFRPHRAANVYLAPEDRVDPRQPNQLLDATDRFPGHAAHGLASISDLWVRNGPETVRIIDALKVKSALAVPDPVRVVRCFSRLVDFGFLSDHLAAAVFQAGDSWPNPDMTRFDRIADPGMVMPSLVDDFMTKHAEVLGLGEPDTIKLDPPPRLRLLEALKLVVRELIARLRRKPFDWAEQQMARMHDHVAKLIENAAPDDLDLHVRRWHDHPEEERSLRGLAHYLDKPRPEPDPAVEPTWTDLRTLTFGLVDGSAMPDRISQEPLTRGRLRAVVTNAHRIVPDLDLWLLDLGIQARIGLQHLVVLAALHDGRDAGVEPVLERSVFLAHAAADAFTEDRVHRPGRLGREGGVLLQERLERGRGFGHIVEAAGLEVGQRVVQRVVQLHLGDAAEILLHEVGVNGRGLHADDLALEAVRIRDVRGRGVGGEADQHVGRVIVHVGEVDHLLALVGDGHRRPDHVDLLFLERGDDAIPGDFDQLALDLLGFADRAIEVHFKADPLARRVLGRERRIRFGRDADADRIRDRAGRRRGRSLLRGFGRRRRGRFRRGGGCSLCRRSRFSRRRRLLRSRFENEVADDRQHDYRDNGDNAFVVHVLPL
jgi:hypothetical protein